MKEIETIYTQPAIQTWNKHEVQTMYEVLEKPNWAPWLAASVESLAGRCEVFPEGQLVLKGERGKYCASLSMNKIVWDGKLETLPSWDDVAGDPTTYEKTYVPDGNTLCLMSMNVNPEFQGQGYARLLIAQAKQLGQILGVDHIIGSFRPNEYGKHKLQYGKDALTFEEYCTMNRPDGLPADGWLRNLSRNGMKPLQVDKKAMVIPVPLEEFNAFKGEYHTGQWIETEQNSWECGEVGTWHVDIKNNTAVYVESNLWGTLWKKPGLP